MYFSAIFWGKLQKLIFMKKSDYLLKSVNLKRYQKETLILSVDEFTEKIKKYDIISFDIFDTLIFRPMALPTDVFYMIGERLDLLDFKNVRVWAEWDARMKCKQRNGHMEVTLQDIWENLAEVPDWSHGGDAVGVRNRGKTLLCKSVYAAGMETSARTGEARDHCF